MVQSTILINTFLQLFTSFIYLLTINYNQQTQIVNSQRKYLKSQKVTFNFYLTNELRQLTIKVKQIIFEVVAERLKQQGRISDYNKQQYNQFHKSQMMSRILKVEFMMLQMPQESQKKLRLRQIQTLLNNYMLKTQTQNTS